jgi:hypothetical protein
MNANRMIAPLAAVGVLLSGCGDSSPQTLEAAASSSSAEAEQLQPSRTAQYFPDGSMILHVSAPSRREYFPDVYRYCEQDGEGIYDLVEEGNAIDVGSSIARTAGAAVCKNGTLTQEDYPQYPIYDPNK